MISNKSKVLAAVAIADKINTLNLKKAEYVKWRNEGDQSEENKQFWRGQISYLDVITEEYREARNEMING
jgi:hypothetical protein